jgi:hypothetical protein
MRRRQSQRRRRDVFFALLAGVIASLILSVGLPLMWPVQFLFDAMFGGYLMLLIRARNISAEREMKLAYMPTQRRSSRMTGPSYEFGGAGYGELGLRRVAN